MNALWGAGGSTPATPRAGEADKAWSFTSAAGPASRKRTRFNLLVLEHGEYYFQDYGAFMYPPDMDSARQSAVGRGDGGSKNPFDGSFGVEGRARHQGRLKVCSRGLVFEPVDVALPMAKYPFREMRNGFITALSRTRLRFECSTVLELKGGNKIGPYVVRKCGDGDASASAATSVARSGSFGTFGGFGAGGGTGGNGGTGGVWSFVFELAHTTVDEFLAAAQPLLEVSREVRRRGHGSEAGLLAPLLAERLEKSRQRFDHIHLADFRETLLLPEPLQVDRVTPLLRNPGSLMVTDGRIYFQPADLNSADGTNAVLSFPLDRIALLCRRRHMLRQTGFELFLADGTSAYFNFVTPEERDKVYRTVVSQPGLAERLAGAMDVAAETRRWQRGEVSNYHYLCFLNSVSDRSVNDLTQYPVFPWVLADYTCPVLDLADPAAFRDLSKPVGALTPDRLAYFRERMASMPKQGMVEGIPPQFLYGTHYSSPGYVLFYLVRAAPEHMLCLQNGRFDAPDRMFTSIADTWTSVLTNQADLKELIPEFYGGSGHFLLNDDDLPLGVTQGGQRVHNVDLPPWAKNARDFVRKCRRALESAHVSRHLHEWIDLIFGHKQRGAAAVAADNVFFHLTYEGAVDVDAAGITPHERAALEAQIAEFGQCPRQIFAGPHPCRLDAGAPVVLMPAFGGPAAAAPPPAAPPLPQPPPPSQPGAPSSSAPSAGSDGPCRAGGSFGHRSARGGSGSAAAAGGNTSFSAPLPAGIMPFGSLFRKGLAAAGLVTAENGGSGGGADSSGSTAGASGGGVGGPSALFDTADGFVRGRTRGAPSEGRDRFAGIGGGGMDGEQALGGSPGPPPPVVSLDDDAGFLEELARIEREAAATAAAARSIDGGGEGGKGVGNSGSGIDLGISDRTGNGSADDGGSSERGAAVAAPSLEVGLPAARWGLLDSGSGGGQRRLIELRAGQPLTTLHSEGITGACVGAVDPTVLCTTSKDSTLKISSLSREAGGAGPASSARVRRTVSAELALSCCCLTRDGGVAVAGCWNNSLLLYSVESACVVSKVECAHEDGVSCLCLHEATVMAPDSAPVGSYMTKRLVTGAWDAIVKVWDMLPSGIKPAPTHQLFDLEAPVQAVAIDGSGTLVSAGAEDGAVVTWDLETASAIAHLQANAGGAPVVAVRWGAVGSTACVVVASSDGTLARFSAFGRSGGATNVGCGITGMDSDGAVTFVATEDGAILVVAALPAGGFQVVLRREMGLQSPVRCLSVTAATSAASGAGVANGLAATVVAGADDGVIRLWDIVVRPP